VAANFGSVTGTYDRLYIRSHDVYGGANNTPYPVAAVAYGTTSYSLQLNSAVNYIGIYWSAGDASNRLDFYSGSTLVGSFTTSTALGVLGAAYLGNPANGGSDGTEAFAYLNFFGTDGTTLDRIVFTVTNATGGFESDNHAIAVNAAPRGSVLLSGSLPSTPAPASFQLTLVGCIAALGYAAWLRRRRSA
jgi:hypothetical protein